MTDVQIETNQIERADQIDSKETKSDQIDLALFTYKYVSQRIIAEMNNKNETMDDVSSAAIM